METRALAIALFYAVGTAVGGIAGPVIFGALIHSGDATKVATGFFIGAGAMAIGGLAELRFGVRAEQQSLESIAKPLTAKSVLERLQAVIYRPRPFVRAGAYFGPDRRRRDDPSHHGPWRRVGDNGKPPASRGAGSTPDSMQWDEA